MRTGCSPAAASSGAWSLCAISFATAPTWGRTVASACGCPPATRRSSRRRTSGGARGGGAPEGPRSLLNGHLDPSAVVGALDEGLPEGQGKQLRDKMRRLDRRLEQYLDAAASGRI